MSVGDPPCLLVERCDAVQVLTLNRPEHRNAFNVELYGALTEALRAAGRDGSVGAIVLTGAGSAFCAGTDLREMEALAAGNPPPGVDRAFPGLLAALGESVVPLVAAVNGAGVGLGFTMLAYCDIVVMATTARLKVPFAEMGVPPEAASSYLLPAAMGWQRAAHALLTGDWVSADAALASGVASEVCDPGEVVARAVEIAERIGANGPAARRIKGLMRMAVAGPIGEARAREDAAYAELFGREAKG